MIHRNKTVPVTIRDKTVTEMYQFTTIAKQGLEWLASLSWHDIFPVYTIPDTILNGNELLDNEIIYSPLPPPQNGKKSKS